MTGGAEAGTDGVPSRRATRPPRLAALRLRRNWRSMPTTSSVSDTCKTPARGTMPRVGTKPTTPQNAAGRMTEPAVCVPSANGTMCAATAAADPLDDPPGVCSSAKRIARRSRCKIGQLRGDRLAEDVTAGCTQQRDARSIGMRNAAGVDRRSVLGCDALGVDNILDRHRQPPQRTGLRATVEATRYAECAFRFKPRKRVHVAFRAARLHRRTSASPSRRSLRATRACEEAARQAAG